MVSMSRTRNSVGLNLVSLEEYLARLKPGKLTRDETSLVVSNLGCRHYFIPYTEIIWPLTASVKSKAKKKLLKTWLLTSLTTCINSFS